MCILWTESENIGRSFTISGHGVRGQGLSPMHRGYISSASKFRFSSYSYSHSSVHNRKTLLINNFPMSLMPDWRQSVEYSANYFIFMFFGFVFLLIYACANFPEKDNKSTCPFFLLVFSLPFSRLSTHPSPPSQLLLSLFSFILWVTTIYT